MKMNSSVVYIGALLALPLGSVALAQSSANPTYELSGTSISGSAGAMPSILTAPVGTGIPLKFENGLYLHPSLSTSYGYNDNLMADGTNSLKSRFVSFAPQVVGEFRSKGDRYTLLASLNTRRYSESSSDNTDESQLVLADLAQDIEASCLVAVNLSPQSIADTEFMKWLDTQLGQLKGGAVKLAFELPKFGVANNPTTALHLRTIVRQHGGKFGIDNFGLDAEAMKLIRDIPPDYVKLTGSLIADLPTQADAQEMLKSFVTLAHSLDVMVIAERVEYVEQVTALSTADVDAAQGYYFGQPK